MEAQAAEQADEPATGVHRIKRECTKCHCVRDVTEYDRDARLGWISKTCTKCLQRQRDVRGGRRRTKPVIPTDAPLPPTHGQRVLVHDRLIRVINKGGKVVIKVLVRCSCGRENHVRAADWRRGTAGPVCQTCIGRQNAKLRHARFYALGLPTPTPRAGRKPRTDRQLQIETVPWELDGEAQAFVAEHIDGATLEEVGQYMGLTRERVRQIEALALRRLARACEAEGFDLRALLHPERGPALRHKRGMQPMVWGEVQQRGAA